MDRQTQEACERVGKALPKGAFLTEPFNWSISGPAWDVTVGISEADFLTLNLPAWLFKKNTDCWQLATEKRPLPNGNVKLASAMAPSIELAYIRLLGKLDVLNIAIANLAEDNQN